MIRFTFRRQSADGTQGFSSGAQHAVGLLGQVGGRGRADLQGRAADDGISGTADDLDGFVIEHDVPAFLVIEEHRDGGIVRKRGKARLACRKCVFRLDLFGHVATRPDQADDGTGFIAEQGLAGHLPGFGPVGLQDRLDQDAAFFAAVVELLLARDMGGGHLGGCQSASDVPIRSLCEPAPMACASVSFAAMKQPSRSLA